VLLSLDAELQEGPIEDPERLRIPRFAGVVPLQAANDGGPRSGCSASQLHKIGSVT
jgi:hypothetical protein